MVSLPIVFLAATVVGFLVHHRLQRVRERVVRTSAAAAYAIGDGALAMGTGGGPASGQAASIELVHRVSGGTIANTASPPSSSAGVERYSSRTGLTAWTYRQLDAWRVYRANAHNNRRMSAEHAALAAAQRRAIKALEQACERARALDEPTDADVADLDLAIEAAEVGGVDELIISSAQRRLRDLEELVRVTRQTEAESRLRTSLKAIEALVRQSASDETGDHGALSLLLHVYANHPPKKPSFTLEQLKKMRGSGDGEASAQAASDQVRKALLKAQRDYHPDRNVGTMRETLEYSSEEWEVLCKTICQQLSLANDRMFKGERSLA